MVDENVFSSGLLILLEMKSGRFNILFYKILLKYVNQITKYALIFDKIHFNANIVTFELT